MRTDIKIEASTILQKHVGASSPRHDASEQITSDLVRAQSTLPTECAGDPVFVLEAVDPAFH